MVLVPLSGQEIGQSLLLWRNGPPSCPIYTWGSEGLAHSTSATGRIDDGEYPRWGGLNYLLRAPDNLDFDLLPAQTRMLSSELNLAGLVLSSNPNRSSSTD